MKKINFCLVFLTMLLFSTSCEKYLDKAPEADISEKEVFGNFISFQGYIEDMYKCIMDPDKGQAWNPYLFADETLNNKPYPFDNGDYWGSNNYFYGKTADPESTNPRDRRIWEYAWYAIRTANDALEKIDQEGLFQGTEEEKMN